MIKIKSFTFNPFSENTYVLYNDGKEAFLIDPGNHEPHETETLHRFITDEGLTVKNILLTHAHIDHILGLHWASQTYNVPVLLHTEDRELLDNARMMAQRFGFYFKPFEGESQLIAEGQTLQLGEDELKIYHVPGHSAGSIAFYSETQNFVVSGDVLFEGSIGRTDLYKGDFNTLISSIKGKLFSLSGDTVVHPGHGGPTSIGHERQFNPFLN